VKVEEKQKEGKNCKNNKKDCKNRKSDPLVSDHLAEDIKQAEVNLNE